MGLLKGVAKLLGLSLLLVIPLLVVTGALLGLSALDGESSNTPIDDEGAVEERQPTPTATATSEGPTPTASAEPFTHPDDGSDPDQDLLDTELEEQIGTNPQRKSIVIATVYGSQVETRIDRDRLKSRFFEDTKVANPGENGIEVVFRNRRNVDKEIVVSQSNFQNVTVDLFDHKSIRPCVDRLVVVGDVTGDAAGWGTTPGWRAVVDKDAYFIERVIAHELLHGIVGRFDREDGVKDDNAHTSEGMLSHRGQTQKFSDPTREKLNESGFATRPQFRSLVC